MVFELSVVYKIMLSIVLLRPEIGYIFQFKSSSNVACNDLVENCKSTNNKDACNSKQTKMKLAVIAK